jgi:hypothetical protein
MRKKSKKTKDNLTDKEKKRMKAKLRESQAASNLPPIDRALRYQMIETAAYYIAEKHGFDPRRSVEDWAQAEREIDAHLQQEHTEQ